MSTPSPHGFNPYQSPVPAVDPVVATSALPPELKILKRFLREIQGLGGIWIFFGSLGAIALFLTVIMNGLPFGFGQLILFVAYFAIGGVWILLGAFACMKQMWAVWVGMILSYLSLVGNLILFLRMISIGGGEAICTAIIVAFVLLLLIAIVVQAHRCIRWAGHLSAWGIPLTARPSDYMNAPPGVY
jgi:hypothetical protein